jgi:hypothetical protein
MHIRLSKAARRLVRRSFCRNAVPPSEGQRSQRMVAEPSFNAAGDVLRRLLEWTVSECCGRPRMNKLYPN